MKRFANIRLPTAARVLDVRQENYRTRTIVLDVALDATPGQFVMLWQPRFDEKPYSLVNADPVTLMVTNVGPFSDLIANKQPGDRVWLRGAFGAGFDAPAAQGRIVLVGGGYGVAPLYWLARQEGGRRAAITSIVGARTAADVLFAGAFERLEAPTTRYEGIVTTEDGSAGLRGRVTDALLPMLEAGTVDGIYACGPDAMLAAIEGIAAQYRVPSQLSWEAYMRCGIGICGACEHRGKVLCMDGPVLAGVTV